MDAGDVIDDRFVVERLVAVGGMGAVHRAIDRRTGAPVALKTLHERSTEGPRFLRESRVLQELGHPGIVGFVASGVAPGDRPWLAMEWLEGCDLAARLATGRLADEETVALGLRAAEALGFAHARGLVHRDVKPSNLFLVDGRCDLVRLLDFGIARHAVGTAMLTQTGVTIGTPGYMAPEQARGEVDLDARADVFSLGCVLFECVTGRPPFHSEHFIALLAKVLLEEAPALRAVRPDAPGDLARIVAQMLSRDPGKRPADGSEVARLLTEVDVSRDRSSIAAPSLTRRERRIVSVVLARPPEDPADPHGATVRIRDVALPARIREDAGRFAASVELLRDGSIVGTVGGSRGSATDHAANAAAWALSLRRHVPSARIVLATGNAELGEAAATGDAIEMGASRLAAAVPGLILVDDVTAGLLKGQFDVRAGPGGLELHGEVDTSGSRTLLGLETSFVGRERELSALLGFVDESASEDLARAVLVTAPAGAGKTRLLGELLRKLAARAASCSVFTARADSLAAGSPFTVLSGLVENAAGIGSREPRKVRAERLEARLTGTLPEARARKAALYLREVLHLVLPEDEPELRAARADPLILSIMVRDAFCAFIEGELARGPVVLLVEDLQWGDRPSLDALTSALSRFSERPLLVLAFARPEVGEIFPGVFSEARLEEVRLAKLPRRACERLVKETLGEDVAPATLDAIVSGADGNAFLLEELIRATSDGGTAAAPQTAVAMVQGRFASLPDGARRVARAASVFGDRFWTDGVRALVGEDEDVDAAVVQLTQAELAGFSGGARGPSCREATFRHGIVREAAYQMLADEDRELGHRLAADWLESVGLDDPLPLAEHCRRGGLRERAARLFARAAQIALDGNDLDGADQRALLGLTCAEEDATRARLNLLLAQVSQWRGDMPRTREHGLAAAALAPDPSADRYAATSLVAVAEARRGSMTALLDLARSLTEAPDEPRLRRERLEATARVAAQLGVVGGIGGDAPILVRLREEAADGLGDPLLAAWVCRAEEHTAVTDGRVEARLAFARRAHAAFIAGGDLRNGCLELMNVGDACKEVGLLAEADRTLAEATATSESLGLMNVVATCKVNRGLVLARSGAAPEGAALCRDAATLFGTLQNLRGVAVARGYLAHALWLMGDLRAAEEEATAALSAEVLTPLLRVHSLGVLLLVLLAAGKTQAAELASRELREILGAGAGVGEGELLARVALAKVTLAGGATSEALREIDVARALVEARAAVLDERTRAAFLALDENAEALRLAAEWSGAAAAPG